MSANKFTSLTVEDHIRAKDMWAGTKERIATPMIIFDSAHGSQLRATYQPDVMLSPALFKCLDEPIVNALDQAQRCETTTEIRIDFDSATGRISIANNGEGIPCVSRKSTGHMLIPQFVFGVVFTGSNMKSDSSSTLGGTNGIGVKITNIHSLEFRVETHDRAHDRTFSQVWTNGMRDCGEPVVTRRVGEGTRITFLLDYANFRTPPAEFEPIVFTRVVWAAVYLAQLLPRTCIFWNGQKLNYTLQQCAQAVFMARAGAAQAAAIHVDIDCLRDAIIVASPDVKRYTMSIINGIMVPSGNHVDYVLDAIKSATKDLIAKRLRAKISATSEIPGIRAMATRLAVIILWRAPGVHWQSQSKDSAKFVAARLSALAPSTDFISRISSSLSDSIINKLDKMTGSRASSSTTANGPKIEIDKYTPARFAGTKQAAKCRLFLAEGDSAKSEVEAGISGVLNFDYFGVLSLRGVIPNVRKESIQETDQSGTARYKRSKKLIDNKFMTTLIQVLGLDFTKDYKNPQSRATLRYGGVIGCVDQDLDGVGNIFSLLLNLFHLYWPALFDAGYIRRLATPIIRAYPKVRRSTKQRSAAPTAAIPSAHQLVVKEFYSDEEYQSWVDSLEPEELAKYNVNYYKGLGTHGKDEIRQIMRNLQTQMITYQNDEDATETFEIYLGRNPALRREQLSQPPPDSDPDVERDLARDHVMPSSYHLLREAHAYQLDNLHRKINDIIGGTNQVSCKIINGSLKVFASGNDKHKVVELAGVISATENYHHGETSLQDAIVRRAFLAPGGNQLPLFLQHGQFGDREMGTDGAASARYIYVRFNTPINNVLYSPDDYALLDFHVDEGKRGEPHYFVPIVPMAILENVEVPAHGWNIRIYAREVMDVIANVRLLIKSNGAMTPRPMRPCCYPTGQLSHTLEDYPSWDEHGERVICDCTGRTYEALAAHDSDDEDEPQASTSASTPTIRAQFQWHGYIIERAATPRPETWSLGTYIWATPDTITITELPLGIWTKPYVKELEKIADREDSFIKKYLYRPNATCIDIQVTFNPDSIEFARRGLSLAEPGTQSPARLDDPIICALYLREHMADCINLMMPDESIKTFDSYTDVLAAWFPIRRGYYARRITRQQELRAMWILYYENVLRYISLVQSARATQSKIANIAHLTVDEAEAALASEKFVPLNIAALESPELKYEPNVAAKVRGPDASFAYILNLRERDITKDGYTKYQASLAREQAALSALNAKATSGTFPGATIWLEELDALERAINWGRETDWKYDEFGRYKYT